MDSYEKLANAIVLQAVKDYRTALKRVASVSGSSVPVGSVF